MPNVSGSYFGKFQDRFTQTKKDAASPGEITDRLGREKPPLSRTDGRVLRSKGKSVVVNYRVTPQFKQDLYDLAQAKGLTMTEVLEEALTFYKKSETEKK
ncbi:MAG: hypothetical protein APF80_12470 [Alphaproteobacteria bacterium BRH_c36]|nr:MAG: hypothetical protein APF80_12470 [Alphaproteobacteria bacterium BRH_c36]